MAERPTRRLAAQTVYRKCSQDCFLHHSHYVVKTERVLKKKDFVIEAAKEITSSRPYKKDAEMIWKRLHGLE